MASGREHWTTYGRTEGRFLSLIAAGVQPDEPSLLDGLPVPGPHLRQRVHGAWDLSSFSVVGRQVADDLMVHLCAPPTAHEADMTVFDWGCGCGRVLRHMVRRMPAGTRFIGVDIDPEAIAWCCGHLGDVGRFLVNEAMPPIPGVESATVDLLYGVSVMSHLPEGMQDAWLGEIARVLKPGGVALLSVHGPDHVPADADSDWTADFDVRGFGFRQDGGTAGLPDFYQQAFHRSDYIRSHWSRWLEVLAVVPRGMADFQDLVVCRRAS